MSKQLVLPVEDAKESKEKKLILLVGPPGSGKSYAAKNLYGSYTRINQDEQGLDGHQLILIDAAYSEKSIIIDRMNFSKAQRARYIEVAKEFGYTVYCKVFYTPREVCKDRAMKRGEHPSIHTEEDFDRAHHYFMKFFEHPTEDEGIASIENSYWEKPGGKSAAIICDLDGTLCNIEHRLRYVQEKGKKNWEAFFGGIQDDTPNGWCLRLLNNMQYGHGIVYCSGRGEEYRKPSQDWLDWNLAPPGPLFMRPARDFRPDNIVKEIILDFELLPRYKILFAIDDRQQVVDMWRKRGITCLQCAKGDF